MHVARAFARDDAVEPVLQGLPAGGVRHVVVFDADPRDLDPKPTGGRELVEARAVGRSTARGLLHQVEHPAHSGIEERAQLSVGDLWEDVAGEGAGEQPLWTDPEGERDVPGRRDHGAPVARPPLKGALRGVDRREVKLLVVSFVLAGLAAPAAQAEIYRWVDANGTHHYTDRAEEVPPAFRDQVLGREEIEDLPFSQLEGLSVLPGEADGTAAGETPEGWNTPELSGDMLEQAQAWTEDADAAVIAGILFALLAMIGLLVAISALFLLMGCRVVGQESPGFKKAYGIVLVQAVAGALAGPGLVLVAGPTEPTDVAGALGYQLASIGLSILVNALVLRAMLTDSFPRALGIAVVTLLLVIGVGIAVGIGLAILIPLLAVAAA